jgi:hypothetical protein
VPLSVRGTAFKVSSTGVTTYSYCAYSDYASNARRVCPDSKKGQNKSKGFLSLASSKRARTTINMFAYMVQLNNVMKSQGSNLKKMPIALITLTLPSEQKHTDNFIKRNMLQTFLQYCKYHYGMSLYFWKAEVQDNENIHFHITCNVFIEKHVVQAVWNNILSPFGYIDAYKNKMEDKYPSGFEFRPGDGYYDRKNKAYVHTPLWKQKKYYDKGVKTKWSNPPSTRIESVRNKLNLAAYLCRELSKKDVIRGTAPDCVRAFIMHFGGDDEAINYVKEIYPDAFKRPITGNLWGCSTNLDNPTITLFDQDIDCSDMKDYLEQETTVVYSDTYATVHIFKNKFIACAPDCLLVPWLAHTARIFNPPKLLEAA